MYQRFYESTVISKFIKNLLAETNIPIVPFVDILPTKDGVYLYKNNIVNIVNGKQTVYSPYIFGKEYSGLTTKFVSSVYGYDSETHKWLGNYLRTIRGCYGVDLMPLYNCYNNYYLANYKMEINKQRIGVRPDRYAYIPHINRLAENEDTSNKIIAIPIKYSQTYTIAIDCPTPYDICFGYICRDEVLSYIKRARHIKSSAFNRPFTINSNTSTDEETNYYMFINLPKDIGSSIVVLEGNYTKVREYWKANTSILGNTTEDSSIKQSTPTTVGQLSLLQMNNGISYPFSDRLIEYLLLNPITQADKIDNNIILGQKWADTVGFADNSTDKSYDNYSAFCEPKKYSKGVWDKSLQEYLFRLMRSGNIKYDGEKNYTNKNTNRQLDILGYIDKSVEKIIRKPNKEW